MQRVDFSFIGNQALRQAICQNLVSFPAQPPTFKGCESGYIQARAAQLYFVRGWTLKQISVRYGVHRVYLSLLLSDWRVRAIRAGYIQEIPPDPGGAQPDTPASALAATRDRR